MHKTRFLTTKNSNIMNRCISVDRTVMKIIVAPYSRTGSTSWFHLVGLIVNPKIQKQAKPNLKQTIG